MGVIGAMGVMNESREFNASEKGAHQPMKWTSLPYLP